MLSAAVVLPLSAFLASCDGPEPTAPRRVESVRVVQVYASAGVEPLLERLAPLYERSHPRTDVVIDFGNSLSFAVDLDAGTTADVFISAAPGVIDKMSRPPTMIAPWRLRSPLVLIAREGVDLGLDDLDADGVEVAIVSENSQTGEFTRLALRRLDLWRELDGRLVRRVDAGAVVSDVASGGADLGIVNSTDAAGVEGVRVVSRLDLPESVELVFAIGAYTEAGRALTDWMALEEAREMATAAGFEVVGGGGEVGGGGG